MDKAFLKTITFSFLAIIFFFFITDIFNFCYLNIKSKKIESNENSKNHPSVIEQNDIPQKPNDEQNTAANKKEEEPNDATTITATPVSLKYWEDLYPFEIEYTPSKKQKNESKFFKPKQLVHKAERVVENWLSENIILHDPLVFLAQKIDGIKKWNLEIGKENNIVKLDGNYVVNMSLDPQSKDEFTDVLTPFITLNKTLKEQAVPFIYIQHPDKMCKYEKKHLPEYNNSKLDLVIELMKENNIECVDLRDIIHRTDKTAEKHHSVYFETDSHWKPESGFKTAKFIAEYLNKKHNLNIDYNYYNPDNFNKKTADGFLGDFGTILTKAQIKTEQFTHIYPKNDFSLKAQFWSHDTTFTKTGGFGILINKKFLDFEKKELNYAAYMYGNDVCFVENDSVGNNYKVLLLGDSYTNVVEPYLALTVKKLDCVDLREFKGSVLSFVKKHRYDAVIFLGSLRPFPLEDTNHVFTVDVR